MRLSDLVKGRGRPEEDPERKKKEEGKEKPPAEKPDSFRLSEVAGIRRPGPPAPEAEEPPLRVPRPPGAPPPGGEGAARPPAEEVPLDMGPSASPLPEEPQEETPLALEAHPAEEEKPRPSVLDEEEFGPVSAAAGAWEGSPFAHLRERALEYVRGVLARSARGEAFDLGEGEKLVVEALETKGALDALYGMAVTSRDTSNALAIHLVNHATYALRLGIGLRWPPPRLIRLGVASLLHDMGMCRVPQKVRHKEGKLTDEELAAVRQHPVHGAQIIRDLFGERYRWLADAILHEHEREGGQGYPQGLSGEAISEYAKVIGLADMYEALTHPRPQRKGLLPYKAVQEIIQTQKGQFAPRLLKAMLDELSLFSLNSLVRLNSGAIGRVVETLPGQPLRPVVQLLYDAEGNQVAGEQILRLRETPLLHITDSVDESELPG